ncbi:MAG: 2-dehydropantoate 2-reductase [Actinobacteria bacterium]|nr:2-dehydropantoate 2-reductase [Actinomycetota bacterium]
MRIAVFGAGGVGGYLGALLADAGSADVHLLARGGHLDALRRDGLTLRSIDGDRQVAVPATDDPSDVGRVDVVLVTVKSTDTRSAADDLRPLLRDGTAVISFQNGVDNEAWIAERVGERHVLGGAAYIFSTIAEPGVVHHSGGPSRFVFGELDGRRSDRAEAFLSACLEAGIDAELSEDIWTVKWRKFTLICAVAGMTAASRLPLGVLREDETAWEMFARIAEEVCAVAAAEGVDLPDETAPSTVAFAEGLAEDSFSSLYHDLIHGKPMELEALNGAVVRRGQQHGVDVPMNEAVRALLSPWAERHAGLLTP